MGKITFNNRTSLIIQKGYRMEKCSYKFILTRSLFHFELFCTDKEKRAGKVTYCKMLHILPVGKINIQAITMGLVKGGDGNRLSSSSRYVFPVLQDNQPLRNP